MITVLSIGAILVFTLTMVVAVLLFADFVITRGIELAEGNSRAGKISSGCILLFLMWSILGVAAISVPVTVFGHEEEEAHGRIEWPGLFQGPLVTYDPQSLRPDGYQALLLSVENAAFDIAVNCISVFEPKTQGWQRHANPDLVPACFSDPAFDEVKQYAEALGTDEQTLASALSWNTVINHDIRHGKIDSAVVGSELLLSSILGQIYDFEMSGGFALDLNAETVRNAQKWCNALILLFGTLIGHYLVRLWRHV